MKTTFKAAIIILSLISQMNCPTASAKHGDENLYQLFRQYTGTDKDRAVIYAEKYLESSENIPRDTIVAGIYSFLSEYYEFDRFRFSDAIKNEQQANEIYREHGIETKEGESDINLARLYYKIHKYHNSFKHAARADKLFSQMNDTLNQIKCENTIGIIYANLGETDTAYDIFTECSSKSRKIANNEMLIASMNNLGLCSSINGDSTAALTYFVECEKLCDTATSQSVVFSIKSQIATSLIYCNRIEGAKSKIGELREIASGIEQLGNYERINGILHYVTEEYDRATECFNRAIQYYSQGEFGHELFYCYRILSQAYRMTGKYTDAYNSLSASCNIELNKSSISDMYKMINYQNELDEAALLQQDKDRKHKNTLIIIGIITIFLTGVFCTIMLMGRKIYRNKKRELEIKNTEIANSRKEHELKIRNQLIDITQTHQAQLQKQYGKIIRELERIMSDTQDNRTKAELDKVCHSISNIDSDDKTIQEMEKFLPNYDSRLISSLLKDFPNLTNNDKRLCALLSMNLSTKEIADITKQSPGTINVARGRLRNKLGLTGSDISIHSFFEEYKRSHNL